MFLRYNSIYFCKKQQKKIIKKKTFKKKLKIKNKPVNMFWNAVSTFVESNADVSIKLNPLRSANVLASSVGTALKCLKSLLFPTNIITIF